MLNSLSSSLSRIYVDFDWGLVTSFQGCYRFVTLFLPDSCLVTGLATTAATAVDTAFVTINVEVTEVGEGVVVGRVGVGAVDHGLRPRQGQRALPLKLC